MISLYRTKWLPQKSAGLLARTFYFLVRKQSLCFWWHQDSVNHMSDSVT